MVHTARNRLHQRKPVTFIFFTLLYLWLACQNCLISFYSRVSKRGVNAEVPEGGTTARSFYEANLAIGASATLKTGGFKMKRSVLVVLGKS